MQKISKTIKDLRFDRGVTQKELAQYIDATQAVISLWEKGINEPKVNQIIKLSQFFNVSIEYLIGLTDEWGNAEPTTTKLPQDEQYILDLYEQMDEEHRENITATMELFVRNSKKQGRKFNA